MIFGTRINDNKLQSWIENKPLIIHVYVYDICKVPSISQKKVEWIRKYTILQDLLHIVFMCILRVRLLQLYLKDKQVLTKISALLKKIIKYAVDFHSK